MAHNVYDPATQRWKDADTGETVTDPLGVNNNNKPPGSTQPGRPDYLSSTNPDGSLKSPYQLSTTGIDNSFGIKGYGDVNMDPTALNQIKEQAFNLGPSAWAQVANLAQSQKEGQALDSTAAQTAGARATSLANLSRLGGMNAGAAENLARTSARDNAFGQNAVLRQGMGDRSSIALADQSQKAQLLSSIPGMELQKSNLQLQNQAQQTDINKFNSTQGLDLAKYNKDLGLKTGEFNITNQLGDLSGRNAANSKAYSDQMAAWAANQQATATKEAGSGGGSWLCTEADRRLGFEEFQKKFLSRFMKEALKLDKETTRFYLFRCQPLLEKMKEKGANWNKNSMFVLKILSLVEAKQFKDAFEMYCDYTISCIEKYWPDCVDPSFFRIQALRKGA